MTAPAHTRARGPRVGISIVVLVLGAALAVGGVIALAAAAWDTFTGPAYALPGDHQIRLGEGRHIIFERVGIVGVVRVTLTPDDVEVTDPSGDRVPVQRRGTNQTITRDGAQYVSVLQFDAPRDGRYRFSGVGTSAEVMVQRPLQDLVLRNVGWMVAIVVGGLLLVIGFVLLVVGIVRRSNDRRAAFTPSPPTPPATSSAPVPPAPVLPPAAWYADPTGQQRLRYWDGNAWTDHTAD